MKDVCRGCNKLRTTYMYVNDSGRVPICIPCYCNMTWQYLDAITVKPNDLAD